MLPVHQIGQDQERHDDGDGEIEEEIEVGQRLHGRLQAIWAALMARRSAVDSRRGLNRGKRIGEVASGSRVAAGPDDEGHRRDDDDDNR